MRCRLARGFHSEPVFDMVGAVLYMAVCPNVLQVLDQGFEQDWALAATPRNLGTKNMKPSTLNKIKALFRRSYHQIQTVRLSWQRVSVLAYASTVSRVEE